MERQANAMMIVSGVAAAFGAEGDIVDPAQVRADFDAQLCAEPEADTDKAALLEALGIRRRR